MQAPQDLTGRLVVIGLDSCGLFVGLAQMGFKLTILDRGKDVRESTVFQFNSIFTATDLNAGVLLRGSCTVPISTFASG